MTSKLVDGTCSIDVPQQWRLKEVDNDLTDHLRVNDKQSLERMKTQQDTNAHVDGASEYGCVSLVPSDEV